MKNIIIGIVIGVVLTLGINKYMQQRYDNLDVIDTIVITNEYINVREKATAFSKKIYEVLRNEEYNVIEIYDEDERYIWYKIKFSQRRTGWVASDRDNSWLESK